MSASPIPFNRASFTPCARANLDAALGGTHFSGDGPFTRRCHALLESLTGAGKALLTTSCTDALELAALLLNIEPGDEVVVPSFTFVSSINAFVLRGARPVFVDIRSDTLNLDETQLEQRLSPRTKAIIVVHYAGVACEMDSIMAIANRHGIPVVEDNAHGLFGTYRGRALGTFGVFATQSFHETKNISCGEGGALLINDPQYVARAEILREKGTDRSKFLRGQVDKYGWVDLGSSFLLSEILAALLCGELETAEATQRVRQGIWAHYASRLPEWARANGISLPFVPEHCTQPYHMFYLLTQSIDHRQALIDHLRARQIGSAFHYLPLHLSVMGRRFGGAEGDCPVTESISDRLLRLPLFNSMSVQDLERVSDAVLTFGAS